MTASGRQAIGLGTILWVAALIVLSWAPGFLQAAPGEGRTAWEGSRLDRLEEELTRREVHLWVAGSERVWRVTGADVALSVDRVRTRVLETSAHLREESAGMPVVTLEEWRLRSLLRERVAGAVRLDPRPAGLDEQGAIVADQPGRRLDLNEAVRRIRDAFVNPPEGDGPVRVEIPLEIVRASLTTERLQALAPWELLASYTTRFDPTDLNRAANIRLGAQLLDGTYLEPGQVFSFNEVVGPRLEVRGFKPAPVIISRKLVSGIGGGVCQLSSTTYNAALLSGLEVIERRHHSIPVSYLPLGRDATVFDNLIDLRFRNTLAHPVMVESRVEGDQVTVSVWGNPRDRMSIGIRARTVQSLPPPLEWEDGTGAALQASVPEGAHDQDLEVVEPGRTGYVVEVERVFYGPDGQVTRVESLSRDVYPPEPRRVRPRRPEGS